MIRLIDAIAIAVYRRWTVRNCQTALNVAVFIFILVYGQILEVVVNLVLTVFLVDYNLTQLTVPNGGNVWGAKHPLAFVILYIYSVPFKIFGDAYGDMVWAGLIEVTLFEFWRFGSRFGFEWPIIARLWSLATPFYIRACDFTGTMRLIESNIDHRCFLFRLAARRVFFHYWHRRPHLYEVDPTIFLLAVSLPIGSLAILDFQSPTLTVGFVVGAAAIGLAGIFRDIYRRRAWLCRH